jgi:putative endonuclease
MSYYVYMILTKINGRYISYVGYTNNLPKRVNNHNTSKGAKFTKGKLWNLIYTEKYSSKNEAMKNEFKLKKDKIKRNLIKSKYINSL